MNSDLSAFLQYVFTSVAVIVTISMICLVAGQKLIANKAVRRAAVSRQQRA